MGAGSCGINLASNWKIIKDKRDKNYLIRNYIKKGVIFNDPRRPDLIKIFLQEMKFQKILNIKQKPLNYELSVEPINIAAPPTSYNSNLFSTTYSSRKLCRRYYNFRINNCDFFISSLADGCLDLSDVYFKTDSNQIPKRPFFKKNIPKKEKIHYQELEFSSLPKRDISHRETPSTNITRLYFIRVATTTPRYGLDLLDSYCLDGESKTVFKCQIEIITLNPMMLILRFMKDGRL